MTPAQAERQYSRDGAGRYTKHISCELCGRNVGEDYFSDGRCNATGRGLVLHAKCCTVLGLLDDDAFVEVLVGAERLPPEKRARLVTTILDVEKKSRAGCVALRFGNRGKGPIVGVYRNAESGMESDPETPWSVVCESHNTIVCIETRSAAKSITDPAEFCDDCRYGADKPGVY
jgi:hypothetical protein